MHCCPFLCSHSGPAGPRDRQKNFFWNSAEKGATGDFLNALEKKMKARFINGEKSRRNCLIWKLSINFYFILCFFSMGWPFCFLLNKPICYYGRGDQWFDTRGFRSHPSVCSSNVDLRVPRDTTISRTYNCSIRNSLNPDKTSPRRPPPISVGPENPHGR